MIPRPEFKVTDPTIIKAMKNYAYWRIKVIDGKEYFKTFRNVYAVSPFPKIEDK